MQKEELDSLMGILRSGVEKSTLKKDLQKNPRLILPLRLSLGLSQKRFIEKTGRSLSQVSLIRYEKGARKTVPFSKTEKIVDLIDLSEIRIEEIWTNYKKFEKMRNGHLTPEKARDLNKLWRNKFTTEDRESWGRKGAEITNSKQKFTEQEKKIKTILDLSHTEYITHKEINTKVLPINIDFVVCKNSVPKIFIECTERKHDLHILSQAYAYRSRLLKEIYEDSKTIIILGKTPLFAKRIFEKEFDYVIENSELEKLNPVLAQYT